MGHIYYCWIHGHPGHNHVLDQAIRDIAHALGYRRAGPVIQDTLRNAIRAAARRGLLESNGERARRA